MCREKWALWPQFRKLPTQEWLFKGPIYGLPSEDDVRIGTDLSGWGCWAGSPRECPTLYMIWLWIQPGLWSSQLLPGPEHLLSVGAIQQVLLHIALDHRGHDGLGLWVSLRLRAFNFPAPSLSSSLSYWSSSYSHSDDQHLHTRLEYPHLSKNNIHNIHNILLPLVLILLLLTLWRSTLTHSPKISTFTQNTIYPDYPPPSPTGLHSLSDDWHTLTHKIRSSFLFPFLGNNKWSADIEGLTSTARAYIIFNGGIENLFLQFVQNPSVEFENSHEKKNLTISDQYQFFYHQGVILLRSLAFSLSTMWSNQSNAWMSICRSDFSLWVWWHYLLTLICLGR